MRLEPGAILEHLDASGLSKYDMPEFILPLSEMPLTASGKLLKRELVQKVENQRFTNSHRFVRSPPLLRDTVAP